MPVKDLILEEEKSKSKFSVFLDLNIKPKENRETFLEGIEIDFLP